MTLEGTDLIVSPDGISDIDFLDEAESVNALVPHLKRRGVEAIVVLLHEGGVVGPNAGGPGTGGDPNLITTCDNPRGDVVPVVQAMDPRSTSSSPATRTGQSTASSAARL